MKKIFIFLLIMALLVPSIIFTETLDLPKNGKMILTFANNDSSLSQVRQGQKDTLEVLNAQSALVWLSAGYSSDPFRGMSTNASDRRNMRLADGRNRSVKKLAPNAILLPAKQMGRVVEVYWGNGPYSGTVIMQRGHSDCEGKMATLQNQINLLKKQADGLPTLLAMTQQIDEKPGNGASDSSRFAELENKIVTQGKKIAELRRQLANFNPNLNLNVDILDGLEIKRLVSFTTIGAKQYLSGGLSFGGEKSQIDVIGHLGLAYFDQSGRIAGIVNSPSKNWLASINYKRVVSEHMGWGLNGFGGQQFPLNRSSADHIDLGSGLFGTWKPNEKFEFDLGLALRYRIFRKINGVPTESSIWDGVGFFSINYNF